MNNISKEINNKVDRLLWDSFGRVFWKSLNSSLLNSIWSLLWYTRGISLRIALGGSVDDYLDNEGSYEKYI